MSLTWKLIGVLVLAMVVVAPPALLLALQAQRSTLETQFLQRARTTANLLDAMVTARADLSDREWLFSYIQRVLWLEPELLAIEINLPEAGRLEVAVSSRSGRVGERPDPANDTVLRDGMLMQVIVEEGSVRHVRSIAPIHVSRKVAGTIQFELSLETLDDALVRQIALWLGYAAAITAVLALVLLLVLRRLVLLPVGRLSSAVEALGARQERVELEVRTGDELGLLSHAFNRMSHDLRSAQRRAQHLALHDPLTDLPNRRLFLDRLQRALAQTRRTRREGAVIYIDLDGFKPINDALGHAAGDRLLQVVAGRLRLAVRAVDTVARLGGDEFTVLVDDLPPGQREDPSELLRIGEKLLHAVNVVDELDGQSVCLSASAGVRIFDGREESTESVLRDADRAMYQAKAQGRNQIRVHAATD